MSDIFLDLIEDAWRRIGPRIKGDPGELRKRMLRRESGMMRRPPRAWCLAVRAADTRISPASAIISPEGAAYPGTGIFEKHEVLLNAKLLRRLCRPVVCPRPYAEVDWLMKELGCSLHNIKAAIKAGVFSVRKIQNLGGKWGWPVPVLSTRELLDPSARLREQADVLWGTTWRYLCEHVPEDLEEAIVRVPTFTKGLGGRYSARGEIFSGWKWVCPKCDETCRTIFYPMGPMYGLKLFEEVGGVSEKSASGFGCMRCHNVLYFSRINMRTWNHLISHLSDGLLFGADVKRPSWYVQQRKRKFHPILRREPSKRREEVLRGILDGLTYREIGERLGIKKSTVASYAGEIFRQRGVKGLAELRAKNERRDAEAQRIRAGTFSERASSARSEIA
jgi:DNA-binding CsgD family transcriptional regulator